MLFSLFATAALWQVARACVSYAVDFKDGGSYFINSNSNESFTTISEFSGCTGNASVILEAPNEDSYFCSDIETTPDYTQVTSTCPILKSQLYSGYWTIVILDNNGNGSSYSGQRVFYLDVGEQTTVTSTPTVTLSATVTPTTTTLATITDVETVSLTPETVTTLASNAQTQTKTIYPSRVTITTTSSATVKRTTTEWTDTVVFATVTSPCAVVKLALSPDPTAEPNALSIAQAALASATPAAVRRRGVKTNIKDRNRNVAKRYGAPLVKRGPDSATTTVTDSDPADWATYTSSFTAAAATVTAYTTVDTTTTVTPAPITVTATKTTTTVTAKTSTRTVTVHTTSTSLITKTATASFTITTYVSNTAC